VTCACAPWRRENPSSERKFYNAALLDKESPGDAMTESSSIAKTTPVSSCSPRVTWRDLKSLDPSPKSAPISGPKLPQLPDPSSDFILQKLFYLFSLFFHFFF
jgi:hypothetical protein